jgi:protein SCO1/2
MSRHISKFELPGVRERLPILILATLLSPAILPAVERLPSEFEGVGVDEKVGQKINLDLTFIAENGYPVPLRSYFREDKPVLLNLVYYSCPMLCNRVLNGQTEVLRELAWTAGKEFEVVTISIDPTEMFDLAQHKRAQYLESYGKPTTGWHFLSDTEGHSRQLADQLGFHYKLDERTHQYAHAAAIMVLAPEGKVARYLYGVKFKTRDLRLALTEAAEGRGSFNLNRFLLICFHYDPHAKGYVLFATNIMRIGGGLCALILGLVIWRLFRSERYRNHPILVPAK